MGGPLAPKSKGLWLSCRGRAKRWCRYARAPPK